MGRAACIKIIIMLHMGPEHAPGEKEKVILDLFFTLGSGTSRAQNENLIPLLNTTIPLISGKYGLRNHF